MAQFGAGEFTTRSREAVEAASWPRNGRQQHHDPVHLLVALLRPDDGTARTLVVARAPTRPRCSRPPSGPPRPCPAPPARRSSSRPPPPR